MRQEVGADDGWNDHVYGWKTVLTCLYRLELWSEATARTNDTPNRGEIMVLAKLGAPRSKLGIRQNEYRCWRPRLIGESKGDGNNTGGIGVDHGNVDRRGLRVDARMLVLGTGNSEMSRTIRYPISPISPIER